ncbi:MAG: metallophosphoesterase [Syntrophobacterales bacterium]|nr:MAG: metallophosphoesterase [Syntrophobacterales bacterium]
MNEKKYAILGDIHGNIEALEAVLKDAAERGCNRFVCVGDIVGYNANPSECVNKIRELEAVVVRGNHDHYCSHDECLEDFHPLAARVVDWTKQQLDASQIEFLRNLKLSVMIDGFTLVHSTLVMPERWGYVFDPLEADASFNYQTTSVCFHGHTHLPTVYEKYGRVTKSGYTRIRTAVGKKYFINVGSVGQPRDGDPRCAYVIYDMKTREIELRRLQYDIPAAQEKIVKAGLPERLAKRLEMGK